MDDLGEVGFPGSDFASVVLDCERVMPFHFYEAHQSRFTQSSPQSDKQVQMTFVRSGEEGWNWGVDKDFLQRRRRRKCS